LKILLISDLHFQKEWFLWVAHEAPQYDLVCLAGDLLDGFSDEVCVLDQILWLLKEWKPIYLQTGVPLVVSSGNHDFNGPALLEKRIDSISAEDQALASQIANTPHWMSLLEEDSQGLITSDRRTQVLEVEGGTRAIISTIPDNFYEDEEVDETQDQLFEAGASLRREHKVPWIVLNHQPPIYSRLSGHGCPNTRRKMSGFEPDYVFCGHDHSGPYQEGGSFFERLGNSACFNGGQVLPSMETHPNHVVINMESAEATWRFFDRSQKVWKSVTERLSEQ
jgi:Icc-related predicted phosphoesterase